MVTMAFERRGPKLKRIASSKAARGIMLFAVLVILSIAVNSTIILLSLSRH